MSHPNPTLHIEHRPSPFTGISWHIVLRYKDHHFEELLPYDFGGLDEAGQNLVAIPAAERLRQQLAPILITEDFSNGL